MSDRSLLIKISGICLLFGVCVFQAEHASAQTVAQQQLVLRFVDYPSVDSNVVVLGDLVEIQSGFRESSQKLLSTPLGPAPRVGQTQDWDYRDVLQHLKLRGVDTARLRWTGNKTTKLRRNEKPTAKQAESMLPAFATNRMADQAKRIVEAAIGSYLDTKLGEETDWQIDASFPKQYVNLLRTRRSVQQVGGGQAPWEGSQAFVIQVRDRDRLINIPVQARVELPPMVLSAKTGVRKEQILQLKQLSMIPLPSGANVNDYYTKVDELVGQQVKRSIATGLAIKREYVGRPIIVQRNDLVQIESVAGGIVITTSGRSRGAGAEGDLIEVETLERNKLYATIVGRGRVRIAAVSTRMR